MAGLVITGTLPYRILSGISGSPSSSGGFSGDTNVSGVGVGVGGGGGRKRVAVGVGSGDVNAWLSAIAP